jgi:NADPH-dependent 2,4-dienoyl-CoA reductase/sulfur reductase-like enzyme
VTALVVGAGLGGLRVAESLRRSGYGGPLTVLGDEPHVPYNRPPLSKQGLAEGIDMSALEFGRKALVDDVDWRLGLGAGSIDLAHRSLTLADGTVMAFDGLAVASGIRPRRLAIPGPTTGRYRLRTVADALALRAQLRPGVPVVIIGAGFIGCETAATARTLGCEVHVVAIDEEPMARPLGAEVGAAMRHRHERHGVHFHLGLGVEAFHGGEAVQSISLDDGTELATTVVIEAVGSVANVEWLAGNGLDLSDGLLVDSAMQVATPLAPVVAVGDVARHPNVLFGGPPRRVEHWNMATETGRRAGATLAALLAGEEPDRSPFAGLPSFWSDQYDYQLQSFGMPGIATRIEVVEGSVDAACIVEYHDASGLVGVVGIDRTRELTPYRTALLDRRP